MPLSRMAKTRSSVARACLLGVHAGRGLVQEQQARFARHGAGDFELALFAVGEVAGEVVGLVVEADELQQFHGAFAGGGFCLAEAGAWPEGRPEAFLGPGVAADEHVLQDGHVGEEPDVLEGAGDAGAGDEVGLRREDGALATLPSVGTYRPVRQLKKVVLPAPLGPMRPTISPELTVRSTLRTAVRPPKRMVTPLASSTGLVAVVVVMWVTPCLGDADGGVGRACWGCRRCRRTRGTRAGDGGWR